MSCEIGRNDPCPCGSGLKYKKCCIDKKDDATFSTPQNYSNHTKKLSKHQGLNNVHILIIPNVLKKYAEYILFKTMEYSKTIADNGHVYMARPKADHPFAIQTKYGRKEASVFTGFCKHHNKTLFQPIEDRDFKETEDQILLFIYRCFALEYHRKQESIELQKYVLSKRPSLAKDIEFDSPFKGMYLAVNDFEIAKKAFDAALINKQYNILTRKANF